MDRCKGCGSKELAENGKKGMVNRDTDAIIAAAIIARVWEAKARDGKTLKCNKD